MELRRPWSIGLAPRSLELRRRLRGVKHRKAKHAAARTCDDDDVCTGLPAGGGRPPLQQVQNTAAPRGWLEMVGRKSSRRSAETDRRTAGTKGLGDNLEELQLEMAMRVTSTEAKDVRGEMRVWDFPAGAKRQQAALTQTCAEPPVELLLDDDTDSECDSESFEDLAENGERRALTVALAESSTAASPNAVRLQC